RREAFVELAQRLDRLARRLQGDARVEHLLDDLELDEVAKRIQTLGAAAVRVHDRRPDEVGTRPIVELAVRDPHDLADLWTAVTGVGHRCSLATSRHCDRPYPRCADMSVVTSGSNRKPEAFPQVYGLGARLLGEV